MANTKVPKFKKGEHAYFFNQSTAPIGVSTVSILMVTAWQIYVTDVKKTKVHGFVMNAWKDVKHMHPAQLKHACIDKLTANKIKNMQDHQYLRMSFIKDEKDLMTKDELKLAMITWIANDFSDPTDDSHLYP